MHTHMHGHIHAYTHSAALRPGDHQHFPSFFLDSAFGPGRSLGVDPPTFPLGCFPAFAEPLKIKGLQTPWLRFLGLLGGRLFPGRSGLTILASGEIIKSKQTPLPAPRALFS